jgi:endonuclease YncB( thermonuclease family)
MTSAAHVDGRWPFDVLDVVKVHDGDTPTLRLDHGHRHSLELELRIAGINAPELDANGGIEAREFLLGTLSGVPKALGLVAVTHRRMTSDNDVKSLDRWVGELYLFYGSLEQIDVASLLVESGHAVRVRYGLERW